MYSTYKQWQGLNINSRMVGVEGQGLSGGVNKGVGWKGWRERCGVKGVKRYRCGEKGVDRYRGGEKGVGIKWWWEKGGDKGGVVEDSYINTRRGVWKSMVWEGVANVFLLVPFTQGRILFYRSIYSLLLSYILNCIRVIPHNDGINRRISFKRDPAGNHVSFGSKATSNIPKINYIQITKIYVATGLCGWHVWCYKYL